MPPPSFHHVPLARLCKVHKAFADKTPLAGNLGDGVLYERNAVFRRVRDAATASGCTYTTDDPTGYFAWPLVQLPALLASRSIPYRRTFLAVSALAAADAHAFTTANAESLELQPNVVMHESAHCVADAVWQARAVDGPSFGKDLAQLLRFTIAESFANTTELAAMSASQTTEDRWFLSFNSYWSWNAEIADAWSVLADALGPDAPTRWTLACFFSANLQKKKLMPELAPVHGLTPASYAPPVQGALRLLHDEAFNLNPVFRRDTFDMFFRSIGCDPQALRSLSLGHVFKPDGMLARVFDELVRVLAGTGAPSS